MKRASLTAILCLALSVFGQQMHPSPTSVRLHYALLNDTSGRTSWPNGISQQVKLEDEFLTEVIKPDGDLGNLVNFADAYYLDVQHSTDPKKIENKIIHNQRGGTGVWDAVVAAANYLDKNQVPDYKRAVFLFSDGDDDASRWPLAKVITQVQAVQIPVFVIAPVAVEHKKQGKDLDRLATATGGRAYFVPKKADSFDFADLKRDLGR
jgi:hypothetical protein